MKNAKKLRSYKASRSIILDRPSFKLGYLDAFNGAPYRQTYEQMTSNDQLWYEQGRLCAANLKYLGVAPMWRPEVGCPRDLPKLIKAYGIGK